MNIDTVSHTWKVRRGKFRQQRATRRARAAQEEAGRQAGRPRQLYDIPRVSKRQWVTSALSYTGTYTETRAYTRARLGVLSVCSYAKRARDLRLFCQPSRLSLVLRSLLCFTLLVLAISFSLSSSPVSFSSQRLFPLPVRLAPSRSCVSLYVRASLFLSLSLVYILRAEALE